MDVRSFLPPMVLDRDREKPWMEWVPGTVLFSDVSGFTPMSEALSVLGAEGAEILTDVLNRYFSSMIGIVHAHGGQVMKFGGDAILCFFPESDALSGGNRQQAAGDRAEGTRDPEPGTRNSEAASLSGALRAAWQMQGEMPRFQNIKTPVKRFALKMKIGLAHGECLLAGVGDPAVRRDYAFAGEPVDATSDAEHHAVAGEIVFAGDEGKLQNANCKMEEIQPGFHRVLDVPAELETRDPKRETPAAALSPQPSALRSYLIAEVHDQVASGHASQVAALLEVVPVFLKFTGFAYKREEFDLERFDAFFRTVMEITERHGGRLNRISMGDKGSTVLLLFGAPNPLEKKEQLASQWALDLFAALRSRFPKMTYGAGMNSGRVFTGIVGGSDRWEYTVMGDAVNFAARLMQGAEAGQACASEAFVQRAKEVYGFDELGKRKFKGKAEPLAVFTLKERRRAGWTAGGLEQSVGREREMGVVLERLDRAWSGEPGMAVIEGEAGVGKSFLATRALQTAHRRGWRTIPVRGEITRRSHAYAPWKDLLGDLLFQGMDPDLDMLEMVLLEDQKPFLPWFAEFFDLPAPEGREAPKHDEETKKRLFQHQLSRLLLNACPESRASGLESGPGELPTLHSEPATDAARHQPLFIFLDDLHWFDTLSLELLAAVLNHLKDQRLFLLAATRPEWERKEFEHRATVTILSLADLDREGCKVLAEGRLGGKVRDALADFLYERAQGNPFFTHQLLDYLLHEDLLETRLGEWLMKRGVEQRGAMSGTEVLLAQVNRLPAAGQAHLRAAACMGPTFELVALQQVMGRSFRIGALKALRNGGFFQEVDAGTWTFPHALVQETLYRSLPQRIRRRLHRKIGLCLEARHTEGLAPLYPNLANHFLLSGVRAKAVEYSLLAARRLAECLSFPESANYYRHVFGLLRRVPDERKWGAGLALCDVLLKAGRIEEGLSTASALQRASARQGRQGDYLEASLHRFNAMQKTGVYGYRRDAVRLLARPDILGNSKVAKLQYLLGIAEYRQGGFQEAVERFRTVLLAEAMDDPQTRIDALVHLASIEKNRGRFEAALEYLEQGRAQALHGGHVYPELRLRIETASTLMIMKRFNESRDLFLELLPAAEQYGDTYLAGAILLNLGSLHLNLGEADKALPYLSDAKTNFKMIGTLNALARSIMQMGIAAYFQADYQGAYEHYMEALHAFEKTGERLESCHGYYNLAEVCLKLETPEEAARWWDKGIACFRKEDNPELHGLYQELKEQIPR
jgi:class 3 adenylate cyclase/tetratricopeptide (TPR) repeat protein